MKKSFTFLVIAVLLLSTLLMAMPVKATTQTTIIYGDFTLPQGGGSFWMPHIWDLTQDEVTISYALDLTDAPNQAYYWSQSIPKFSAGYVGLVWPGSPWAGAWMCGFLTDWDNKNTLFPVFPDRDGTQDMDDKFNMQRSPNSAPWDETLYDVLYTTDPPTLLPKFGSYSNYGIWFDRDGVDQWQAKMWGMVNGGTYNTHGLYGVELTYSKFSSTKGIARPLLFPTLANSWIGGYGIPTGFNSLSGGGYQYLPAGISFDTDETKMAYMKVLVSGDSGDGKIVVKDLKVTGVLATIPASVNIDPDTLNLKTEGNWITAYITPPEGYSVNDIDLSSVKLGVVPASWGEVQGTLLMVKFDRQLVANTLSPGSMTLTITGELTNGQPFTGSDTIRVVSK